MSRFEYWGKELSQMERDVLKRAAAHLDGFTLTTRVTARRLEKRGLVEDYGGGRVQITDAGIAEAKKED